MEQTTKPVYLIFGGTGGIGSALARRLAESGARLGLVARTRQPLDELAGELDAEAIEADATRFEQVDSAVERVIERFGRLDGAVNCVGSILLKPAHLTSEEEYRQTIALNLDSSFALVRAAARPLTKTNGSLVLLSTAAAQTGLMNHEAIAAAKAGVEGLARSAAATYAKQGVRVNVVAPGLVDTPLAARITGNAASLKASEAMHPLGRIGRAEDVASAIAWLLDPAQSWVTGQVLSVDGGLAHLRGR